MLTGTSPSVMDSEIIASSLDDPEEFAALFDRHAATLYRYVSFRLGPELADDLVGETFLVAFRRRDAYDVSYRDAQPWLLGIATKLVTGHRRAEVSCYRALARQSARSGTRRRRRAADRLGLGVVALVVAGCSGAVAAGRFAPFLASVALDEVADAARRVAGPQPFTLRAAQEVDGGPRQHGDQSELG